MILFAHHVGVELLGREFSPHGVVQHVCVFAALGLLFGTSAYGSWTLYQKSRETGRVRHKI
jgi:hypothetical protein